MSQLKVKHQGVSLLSEEQYVTVSSTDTAITDKNSNVSTQNALISYPAVPGQWFDLNSPHEAKAASLNDSIDFLDNIYPQRPKVLLTNVRGLED